jgi:predicted nucleotidyltransferase
MRLLPYEVEAIRTAVPEVFGPTARTRLFGSRTRDDPVGGDFDLFVEVEPGQASIANEQRLRDRIAPAVEDLRPDVVLHERGAALTALEGIAPYPDDPGRQAANVNAAYETVGDLLAAHTAVRSYLERRLPAGQSRVSGDAG